MSELALKLILEAKKTCAKKLGNCGLTELPDELFELGELEENAQRFDVSLDCPIE